MCETVNELTSESELSAQLKGSLSAEQLDELLNEIYDSLDKVIEFFIIIVNSFIIILLF